MQGMTDRQRLRVAGGRAALGSRVVTAPYDGQRIAEVETGGDAHVEDALAAASALFSDRERWLPVSRRIELFEAAVRLMESRQEALALLASREGGKPLRDSRVEVIRAIDGLRICIDVLRSKHGRVVPMGASGFSAHRIAFTQKFPIGVVVAVSAFNHPLNLIVHQAAAALAAGCPVIVKPAQDTPLSALAFAALMEEAGLPAHWCQVLVTENNEVAERLVTDPRVAFFSFIGSPRVGWALRSKLAPGTRCALEHGGAAPVILVDDCDESAALAAVLKGGFYHAGQVCISVQRVFAPRGRARAFAQALADAAAKLRLGDPTDPATEVGPLIRKGELERVHEWVEAAIAGGAERLAGGAPLSESLYPCTVLLEPPPGAQVSKQEIFGPVVCVYAYDTLDDALKVANSLPYAFQGAVFTRDIDTALRVFQDLDGSAIMVNDHSAFREDGMPFAGLRESGLGVGGLPQTIDDMSIDKMLVLHSAAL